ncbi:MULTISPECIES: hypothetical protein [unclassified Leclercia]|uniref:Uncharacterized protein n=1 Tax=Leclercia barmai TaxID=2785629 RepID=A0ABS7RT09_9ENTR|nr:MULTISPECIES: hypothetical protein [unclassified Leclercia]MBZ0057449.1 hypothetical protein [Leclercia sp. EMC7]MCM5695613.1 hypothetical protein [Leclercia sp. LTM01]MCM5700021.1 hypothetical protein [Leclercia sp. LTM14]
MKLQFANLDLFHVDESTSRVFIYAQAAGQVLTLQAVRIGKDGSHQDLRIMTMNERIVAHDRPAPLDLQIECPYCYGLAILNVPQTTLEFVGKPYVNVFTAFNTGRKREMLSDENDFLTGLLMTHYGDYEVIEA